MHECELPDKKQKCKYFYQLGGSNGQSSEVLSFSNSWVTGLQTAMREVNELSNFSEVDVTKFLSPTKEPTKRIIAPDETGGGTSTPTSASTTGTTSASTTGTTSGTSTGSTTGTTTGTTTCNSSGGTTFTGPFRMFVFANKYTAQLHTNLATMDAACTAEGNNAFSVDHSWFALVSVPGSNARNRIDEPGVYINTKPVAEVVASTITELWSGTIQHSINYFSNGGSPTDIGGNGDHIWTGSMSDGTYPSFYPANTTCNGYTDTRSDYNGIYGNSNRTSTTWLTGGPSGCNMQYYIYCVEQPKVSP